MKKYPAEFPKGEHQNCQTLTDLVLEHLPRDGSQGRARRFAKGRTCGDRTTTRTASSFCSTAKWR